MKKTVSLMVTALLAVQCLMAQVADGIKFLNYEKYKSARETLKKAYDANPKDPQTIYWYGQSLIAAEAGGLTKDMLNAAKAVYQQGLQDVGSDAWLLVGMGHIEILEGGDINSAKQKFEQAITATTETKGRNKGKGNPGILNAIGRANADGGSKVGDPSYGIEKLKQAAALDLTNPDIYINMGISYLKLGGENGGEAVKAYQEAITRDPKNAKAKFRIGRIYQSQNNKELFEQFYNEAIAIDPTYPPVYYVLYNYYADKDVPKAKEYLDKYVANADKDPKTDLFVADYLFRAGKYNESLEKARQIEAEVGGISKLPELNVVYAYNYDRTNDSVRAKEAIEKFFASADPAAITTSQCELATKIYARFKGSEAQAVAYIEKAMTLDTIKNSKIAYMGKAAEIYGKAGMYREQLGWLQKQLDLKGGTMGEFEYYQFTSTALNGKDYPLTIELGKKYLAAFPDKPQPYSFLKRAALASDPDTTTGAAIAVLDYLDSFYMKDQEKNKKAIFLNLYYRLQYYVNKSKELEKGLEVADKMLALYPTPGDENQYATSAKGAIVEGIKAKEKQGSGNKTSSATSSSSSGS
ncbi:MAG: tetratricopeptide repeat protein [Sediminibacterium sp.]|jgi:tetratricopeptide (TPR) repeat protein|uniref:tetratricopeptide repeat protein n=1 Tax=Sediminibacterium sp. TaxID=1917865 RepID=UPI002AB9DD1F|nr:tetratricopeptide repeat protein [Sediminibacterium sp.]MDZ4071418.1 tetratricopeptide repeat protein [Sediminibacterium sp.]